jgi:hypothetical protein
MKTIQSQITLSKFHASSKMRKMKRLSQLSHQFHNVPQIREDINMLIINHLINKFSCPNIAKNIVKNFLGHFTHKSVNQPLASQKLSHANPKISVMKIIVKNFVGHFTHKSVNQPLASRKLSHKLFLFKNINYIPIIQPIINI